MNDFNDVPEIDEDTLVYGDFPPSKMCFVTIIFFNYRHPIFKKHIELLGHQTVTEHFKTFDESFEFSYMTATKLNKKFKASKIIEVDPENDDDECHLYLISKNKEIIAKIGVVSVDYREESIH